MNRRIAKTVLISSVSLLFLAAILLATGASGTPRSDLVGESSSVASSPRTASKLTTPTEPSTPEVPTPEVTTSEAPSSEATTPEASQPRLRAAQPLRLEVPSVRIDSGIVPVAKNADGSMELPGATETGWYEPGPMVGELFGSAVIAAHVDYNGVRGVFFDLRKVELGNEIVVTDINGVRRSYTVTERFQVKKDALQIPELFRTAGPHVLTLITCGGGFDSGERRYTDNIVIRAEPVQP